MHTDRLYKRGRIWWCWYYDANGEQIRESTKFTDKGAARAFLVERERCASDPAYAAAHSTTLGSALERLLIDRQSKGKAAGTLAMYRVKSGHLARILGEDTPLARLVGTAGARAVDDYTAQRQREEASSNTISKEHTTLRAALKVAKRRGEYTGDITAIMPIGFAPEYKPRRRCLRSGDELSRLLEQLPEDRGAHVCFLVATAARDSEAARAEPRDIDLRRGVVHVRGKKTEASDDAIAIVGWMRPLLEHVLQVRAGSKSLLRKWCNVRRDLGEACDRAGLERLTPNDLRRTHATWLRAARVDLGLVARQLRHVDTRMVFKVYGRLDAQTAGRAIGAALGCDDSVIDAETSRGGSGQGGPQIPRNIVPRDGIEPPTRGFSIPLSKRERGAKQAAPPRLRRVV